MNKIIYARRENLSGERTAKNFEILVPDTGRITVIPPLKNHCAEFAGIRLVFDHALLPFTEVCEIDDSVERAIYFTSTQVLKYLDGDIPKKDLILSSLGNLLVSYLAAFGDKKEFSPVVELVRAEIAKGISDCTFSIRDCLKKLPLNYDYIRKTFKKETGATPAEYLLNERMELARQLISSGISNKFSSYSVSQIAEACGFSEPLYFSRVFKKYFGVSPSEYK